MLRAVFPCLRGLSCVSPRPSPCWSSHYSEGGASACRTGPPGRLLGYFARMDCLCDCTSPDTWSFTSVDRSHVPARDKRTFWAPNVLLLFFVSLARLDSSRLPLAYAAPACAVNCLGAVGYRLSSTNRGGRSTCYFQHPHHNSLLRRLLKVWLWMVKRQKSLFN